MSALNLWFFLKNDKCRKVVAVTSTPNQDNCNIGSRHERKSVLGPSLFNNNFYCL